MKVTADGVTIPAERLRAFGIEPGSEVELEESARGPVLVPSPTNGKHERPGRLSTEEALALLYEIEPDPNHRGRQLVEHLVRAGEGTHMMSADELMALTRGDD